MTRHDPAAVRCAHTLFAAVIRLLPAQFRRRYAHDIEVGFLEEVREAYHDGGGLGVCRATVNGGWDVLPGIAVELAGQARRARWIIHTGPLCCRTGGSAARPSTYCSRSMPG